MKCHILYFKSSLVLIHLLWWEIPTWSFLWVPYVKVNRSWAEPKVITGFGWWPPLAIDPLSKQVPSQLCICFFCTVTSGLRVVVFIPEVFQGFQYCHLYFLKDAIFLEGLTSLVFHSSGTIDLSPFRRSVRNFFFSFLKTKLSLCFFQTLCFFLQTLFAYLLSLPTLYFLPRPRFFRKKVRKSARLILHFLLSLTTSDPPTPRYRKYNYLFESGSIRNVC